MAGLSSEFSESEATVFARTLVIKSIYTASRLSMMFLSKMLRPALRAWAFLQHLERIVGILVAAQ